MLNSSLARSGVRPCARICATSWRSPWTGVGTAVVAGADGGPGCTAAGGGVWDAAPPRGRCLTANTATRTSSRIATPATTRRVRMCLHSRSHARPERQVAALRRWPPPAARVPPDRVPRIMHRTVSMRTPPGARACAVPLPRAPVCRPDAVLDGAEAFRDIGPGDCLATTGRRECPVRRVPPSGGGPHPDPHDSCRLRSAWEGRLPPQDAPRVDLVTDRSAASARTRVA